MTHKHVDAEPSTGSWATKQGQHPPPKKAHSLSLICHQLLLTPHLGSALKCPFPIHAGMMTGLILCGLMQASTVVLSS